MGHVLALLMPENRLAMETALHTGLRISDVLSAVPCIAFKVHVCCIPIVVRIRPHQIAVVNVIQCQLAAHVVLVVKPSYFTSRYYLSQARWTELWKRATGIDYTPIVDVRYFIKRKNPLQIWSNASGKPSSVTLRTVSVRNAYAYAPWLDT